MNSSGGFFLGLIAAIALFLLWKNNQSQPATPAGPGVTPAPGGNGGGCTGAGCGGGGCSGPSCSAAPAQQSATQMVAGTSGQISPGTPPLQSTSGVGSFYGSTGPTSPVSFTNIGTPVERAFPVTISRPPILFYNGDLGGAAATPPPNTPGSPTTQSTIVPPRAVAPVPNQAGLGGFQQRFNIAGVPRAVLNTVN